MADRLSFPPFRPRAPWWTADLQTLRNTLLPGGTALAPGTRLALELDDGDRLLACHHPGGDLPLAVLVHGLTGSEDSTYLTAAALLLQRRGWPVLRLNLRGAGPSAATCRRQYHAGRSDDLAAALARLPAGTAPAGFVMIGWSLGANILLKFLGEGAHGLPVRAAAAVSAPIDLAAAAAALMRPRNWLYQRWLLGRMRAEAAAANPSAAERRAIAGARSVREFDDRFVAPRNGFGGAADYYARCSAQRFLAAVRVPTLLVHALDDPWIPGEAYRAIPWADNPCLTPLLSPRGGHVGFHGAGSPIPWSDRCAAQFFAGVLGMAP